MIVKKAWQKLTDEELTILKNRKFKTKKSDDIIITEMKKITTIEIDENKNLVEITKYETIKTNLTKKINETARKLKIDNTLEILDRIGVIIDEE